MQSRRAAEREGRLATKMHVDVLAPFIAAWYIWDNLDFLPRLSILSVLPYWNLSTVNS